MADWFWLVGRGLALLLWLPVSATAAALPQCPPASPAQISKPGFLVDQLWQRYRKLTPEGRCCSKPCEPMERYNAKVEANALALDSLSRDPRVPSDQRHQLYLDAQTMFRLRNDIGVDFRECLVDTRVITAPGGAKSCNGPSIDPSSLRWYAWCGDFADQFGRFRKLLVDTVGKQAGSWRVQSNYFRIKSDGSVDPGSFSIKPYPASFLPAGETNTPFRNLLGSLHFKPFPDGQSRMYMQLTARVVRTPGTGGVTLDASPLLGGACPGPRDRPR